MYFKKITNDCGYYATAFLPSGQTVKIEFNEEVNKDKYFYNIYLVIMNKRKQENFTDLRVTGKDGLAGLLWAKNKIKEFENFIIQELGEDVSIIIYCSWEDNRRRKVYEYGLKDMGYVFNRLFDKKVLSKKIR